MDQLCEPLEVNRKFIKMIEEVIQPEYEKVYERLIAERQLIVNFIYIYI